MFKYSYLYFIGILIFTGCSQQSDVKSSERSRILNNRGVELMNTNPDSALFFLDSAIIIDRNNTAAYSNMVHVYCNKGDYQKAIEVSIKVLEINPAFVEARFFLGMLYDKTGQPEKAGKEYSNSLQIFNDRIKKNEGSKKLDNEINQAITLIFLGEAEGNRKLDELIEKNPQNQRLKIFKNFDKKEYLNSIFQR